MMLSKLQDDPKLKKYIKKYAATEFLFKQGQKGNTMYLILSGMIDLVAERGGETHVAGLLEEGDFLGEKAIVSTDSYQRYYSARANTDVVVLEISAKDIELLKARVPELMSEVMISIFSMAIKRIQRLNFLIQALRPSDINERLANCVLYFIRTVGKQIPQGIQFPLTAQSLQYHVEANLAEVNYFLANLISQGVIEPVQEGYYLARSEQALLNYLLEIRQKKAA